MWQSTHGERRYSPRKKKKSVFRQSAILAIFTVNTSRIVPQTILQTGKVQAGRNSLKLTEAVKGSKLSYQKRFLLNK